MKFFKSISNFFRCLFCKFPCNYRFHIGFRQYLSGFGFIRVRCPKDWKTQNLTIKEKREQMLKDFDK